jgi:hypothetical protein
MLTQPHKLFRTIFNNQTTLVCLNSSVHTEQNLQLSRGSKNKENNFTLRQSLDSYSHKRKANKDKNKKRGTEKSGAKIDSSQEKK